MSLKDESKMVNLSYQIYRINLTDDADQIINKIKKAKADPLPMPSSKEELDKRQEAKNLIGIYSSLTGPKLEKSINEFSGKNFQNLRINYHKY